MEFDVFLDIADEVQTLTNGTPCYNTLSQEQNLQRVDEVLMRLKGIDTTKMCAELMEGVNSQKEMVFRLSLIASKIGDRQPFFDLPNDWHRALSNPFTVECTKEIKEIMGDKAKAYILKWNNVFERLAFVGGEIENTINKMRKLAGVQQPQQRTYQENSLNNTRDKIESVFDRLADERLIKRNGDVYEWIGKAIQLDFFLGVLLCGDEAFSDNVGQSHWEIMGVMPQKAVESLFPNSKLIGIQRRNKKARQYKDDVRPPIGWELIYSLIKGY